MGAREGVGLEGASEEELADAKLLPLRIRFAVGVIGSESLLLLSTIIGIRLVLRDERTGASSSKFASDCSGDIVIEDLVAAL